MTNDDLAIIAPHAKAFAEATMTKLKRGCAVVAFEGGFVAFFHESTPGYERVSLEVRAAIESLPDTTKVGKPFEKEG